MRGQTAFRITCSSDCGLVGLLAMYLRACRRAHRSGQQVRRCCVPGRMSVPTSGKGEATNLAVGQISRSRQWEAQHGPLSVTLVFSGCSGFVSELTSLFIMYLRTPDLRAYTPPRQHLQTPRSRLRRVAAVMNARRKVDLEAARDKRDSVYKRRERSQTLHAPQPIKSPKTPRAWKTPHIN